MRLLLTVLLLTVLLLTVLLLTSCAPPTAPPLTAPQWDAVPPGVLDTLCSRLRMDAIATGAPLALVDTTRPLATQQSLAALAISSRGRARNDRFGTSVLEANRAIPVVTEGSTCAWRRITPAEAARLHDELIVELSAPALHPFAAREAGLFARVTVGGQGASWYWVALLPVADRWAVGGVSVLSQ